MDKSEPPMMFRTLEMTQPHQYAGVKPWIYRGQLISLIAFFILNTIDLMTDNSLRHNHHWFRCQG